MQPAKLTLEDIGTEALELSQEAMSFTADIDNVREKLPNFFKGVTSFVEEKLNSLRQRESAIDRGLFKSAKEADEYMKLRNKKVPVPAGLSTTFLEHLGTLEENQQYADTLMSDVLIPTEKYLGRLLDKPDNMKSQIEDSLISVIGQRDIDSAKANMHDDFSKDQAQSRKYSDVIKRQGDWDTLYKRMDDLESRIDAHDPIDTVDMVTTISEYLDVIIERLEEDPETYNMSGVTISTLTKLTYLIATEVEFMSVHTFMYKEFKTAVEETAKAVK